LLLHGVGCNLALRHGRLDLHIILHTLHNCLLFFSLPLLLLLLEAFFLGLFDVGCLAVADIDIHVFVILNDWLVSTFAAPRTNGRHAIWSGSED